VWFQVPCIAHSDHIAPLTPARGGITSTGNMPVTGQIVSFAWQHPVEVSLKVWTRHQRIPVSPRTRSFGLRASMEHT
jgi:hypothetical protein